MDKKNARLVAGGVFLSMALISLVKLGRKSPWAQALALPEGRVRGAASAVVTIEEFSDFECPSCQRAQPPLHELMSLYPDDVKIVFKHFPLEAIHRSARQAARAAECARRSGKFWQFHDRLFDDRESWTKSQSAHADFLRYANDLGLPEAAFNACLDDPKTDLAINADLAEGQARQVESTPTFFINGVRLVGGGQLKRHGARLIEAMKNEKTKGKSRI